ncbi:ankyrin repeat domain-containing protein [Ectopseudomonas khazarica]|uniref:ankyrin repeat domain-containing protein n=1 Tax=Ectopseudomonas khazarica TaxID=2502979 RepID=UPI0040342ABB
MKRKLAALIITLPLTAALGLMLIVYKLSIEDLILCTAGDGFHIPHSACKFYLYNLTDEDDARSLSEGPGLSFAFATETPEAKPDRYRVMARLIEIGVDINEPSKIDGLTPLNAAILENDPELVKFLLANGANINKTDRTFNFNAKQFIEHLQTRDSKTNRDEVRQIIFSARPPSPNA